MVVGYWVLAIGLYQKPIANYQKPRASANSRHWVIAGASPGVASADALYCEP